MKLFGKKIALVLALIAVFALAGSALAANTYYVATNGNDENAGTNADSAFATLQHAVDIANDGDTINVVAGTYEGQRVIINNPYGASDNKSLQIIGEGADKTILKAQITNTAGTDQMLKIYGDAAGTVIKNIGFECATSSDAYDAAMIFINAFGTADNPITIENCSFKGGVVDGNDTTASVAIMTTWANNSENISKYLVIQNNQISNVKHGIFCNAANNIIIKNNTIDGTIQNGINIAQGDMSSEIEISGNTLNNISSLVGEPSLSGEDLGINIGTDAQLFAVTNNEINMVEGKQDKALSNTIEQVAQVTITDTEGNERNVYFATLTEAVQSEKTEDGSTITLLTQPDAADANIKIEKNVTFAIPEETDYKPVVDEGVEVITNDDGTITIKIPEVPSEPTDPVSPDVKPSHSSGGGGCSAGFGALALLASVPLMFRRKK